jgi:hypothetical protein
MPKVNPDVARSFVAFRSPDPVDCSTDMASQILLASGRKTSVACRSTLSFWRSLGDEFVASEPRRWHEVAVISDTAEKKAASLAFDGLLKPLIFLTN